MMSSRRSEIGPNSVMRIAKWIDPQFLTTVIGGTGAFGGTTGQTAAFAVNAQSAVNWTQLSALFSRFKIEKVSWYFTYLCPDNRPVPWSNQTSIAAQENARNWPVLYTALDKVTTPVANDATLAAFLDRNPRRRPMQPGRTYVVTCRPIVPANSGDKQGYYRSDTDAGVSFVGLKTYFDFMVEDEQRVDVKCKVHFALRGMR